MEGKPRGRATVCISEAFGFLSDPMYDENNKIDEVDLRMKKSVSVDTGMLQNKTAQNNLFNEKFINSESESADKKFDDTFTIVAYIEPNNTDKKRRDSDDISEKNANDFPRETTQDIFPRETTQDGDIPVIETCIEHNSVDDEYTIVTCIEDLDEVESDRNPVGNSNLGVHSSVGKSNPDVHSSVGKSNLDVHSSVGKSNLDVHSSVGKSNPDVHSSVGKSNLDVHSSVGKSNPDVHSSVKSINNTETNSEVVITSDRLNDNLHVSDTRENLSSNSHDLKDNLEKEKNKSSETLGEEEVILREKDLLDSDTFDDTISVRSCGMSRRTQQIVSEAFGFLKEIDDEVEDPSKTENLCRSNDNPNIREINGNVLENDRGKKSTLKRGEAIDIDISKTGEATLKENQVQKLQDEMIKGDNSRRDVDTTSCMSGTSTSSSDSQGGGATLRRKRNRAKQESVNRDEGSEASSDEDTGVYNESFRKSCWVRVGDNNQLSMLSIASSPHSVSENRSREEEDVHIRQDDVFSDEPLTPRLNTAFHKRTDSNATTTSETEFKKAYQFKKKCIVQRNDSQQEYQRLSEKFYEQEKVVVLERADVSTDLGLHILDSHPAVITTVDKDSPAEKAGVREGQILISVNRVNVLQSSHAEIISLVQQNPTLVTLEVGTSDLHLIRDLQSTVMQGYMYQRSGSVIRNWKRRYFVLRQDNCLYCYKTEQELMDPLGAIPLLNYTVSKNNDNNRPNCFKAEKYGAKTCLFSVETRDEMARWVCAMNEAALMSKKRKDSWMDVTSHNVGLPALEIRKAECSGYLSKCNKAMRNWNKRYCVLKDACIYYYKHMNSQSAQGMAHLHGYTVDDNGISGKRNSFMLRPPESQMRTFYFVAENDTDKKRWVSSISKSVQRWIKVD